MVITDLFTIFLLNLCLEWKPSKDDILEVYSKGSCYYKVRSISERKLTSQSLNKVFPNKCVFIYYIISLGLDNIPLAIIWAKMSRIYIIYI